MSTANITTKRTTLDDPDFKTLVQLLDRELRVRNGAVQDTLDQYNIVKTSDSVVVAYINDIPVGCGCFKEFDAHTVEMKRMFVHPDFRGRGIAGTVLRELEKWAKETGYTAAVLETGTFLHEAVRLYGKCGYLVTDNYGQYIGMENSICMRKAVLA